MDKQLTIAPASDAGALMAMIGKAIADPTFDVPKLQQLLAVKKEWERDEARKLFVSAMTEFKSDPPSLTKNRTVDFTNKTGGKTNYKHASLDHVSITIGTSLAKVGLSHRWNVEQQDGKIKVTCILTHNAGHSESLSMKADSDQSGSKNSIQALASAVTYLERYTLLAITGMAVQDDDDGKAAAPAAAPPAGPQESKPKEVGANNVKIVGVFKNKDTFKVQGELSYFTKHQVFADAAKKLFKGGEEAKIAWERGSDGIFWITDLGRVSETF